MVHNFLNLNIWKRSRVLVKQVYEITLLFPAEEKYGLKSQIRRCAVSIPSNIAEGCGRGTDKQLAVFLGYSIGSICELETQLLLALDLEFLKKDQIDDVLNEVSELKRMIDGFHKKISTQSF